MAERPVWSLQLPGCSQGSVAWGFGVPSVSCLRVGIQTAAEVTRAPEQSRDAGGPQAAVSLGLECPACQACAGRGPSWASRLPAQAPAALPSESRRD